MMKENVFDVLMYLFETYMAADAETAPEPDRDMLEEELERAGFGEKAIEAALEWLDGLTTADSSLVSDAPDGRAIRIYDRHEHARLESSARGYIMYLEQISILSAAQRELVIDRLLALDADEIDTEQVKWVVLMVLFSQPGQEAAYARMEDLVFEDRSGVVH